MSQYAPTFSEGGPADRRLTARMIFALTDLWNLYDAFDVTLDKLLEEALQKGTKPKRITVEEIKKYPSILFFHFERSGRQLSPEKDEELLSKYKLEDLLKGK